jgi:hypothetical protein
MIIDIGLRNSMAKKLCRIRKIRRIAYNQGQRHDIPTF